PLKGIKALRPGLHVGTMKKNRFEPSHALALFLSLGDAEKTYELTEEQAAQYLRGEMLGCEDSYKGWMLLAFQGYSLGFGKAGGGKMKNHYPKGLRK
ncbi:MAG: RsmF rRNA methyltransferase first C-terminal domain-containing protein, partial [Lachnospiraceae bacterium]|nr:RsmF rRNA methyltransferase first C-terminal domain-containing protein [Lachnospiraceae bacterium]